MMTTEEWNDKPTGGQDEIAALQARVAELEAANRGLVRLNETTEARAKAAEAKVKALVEALIRIQDLTQHNMPMTAQEEQCVYREARAALAVIQEDKT